MPEITAEYLQELVERGNTIKQVGDRAYLTCNGAIVTPPELQKQASDLRHAIEDDVGKADELREDIGKLFAEERWKPLVDVQTADVGELIVALLQFERGRRAGCGFILDPYIEDYVAENNVQPGEPFTIACPKCGLEQTKAV